MMLYLLFESVNETKEQVFVSEEVTIVAEIWDILDVEGNPTGRTIERGQPLRPGEYHLAVHAWILDDQGRYLVQKRAEHLTLLPGIWAACGGSAVAGEDSKTAIRRELQEELGIQVEASELRLLGRSRRVDSFLDIWLVRKNIDLSALTLQEEVSEADCINKATLMQMVREGTFHDYGLSYFAVLFDCSEGLE